MITKTGVEVLQGKAVVVEEADKSTVGISFNVAGGYNARNSPVTIASSGTHIEVKITHSKANELAELFKQLELSIKNDVTLPEDAKTARTYLTSLQDVLSLPEEEQDKSVLESLYQKLQKKLQTYERPLSIVGSIALILGLGISLM